MYRQAFRPLFERYHDTQTNPYLESLANLEDKFQRPSNYFSFIEVNDETVGVVRVILADDQHAAIISPLLILPKFQGHGYAQAAMKTVEQRFPQVHRWQVDTIEEEPKLIHLYEKMGYQRIPDKRSKIKDAMHIIFFEKLL